MSSVFATASDIRKGMDLIGEITEKTPYVLLGRYDFYIACAVYHAKHGVLPATHDDLNATSVSDHVANIKQYLKVHARRAFSQFTSDVDLRALAIDTRAPVPDNIPTIKVPNIKPAIGSAVETMAREKKVTKIKFLKLKRVDRLYRFTPFKGV